MKKYFLVLICLLSLDSFGQSFKAKIDAFRKGYTADFLTDKSSPLSKDDLQFLRFYDADSTYRVEAKAEILVTPSPFIMPVFAGTGSQYVAYAKLTFTLNGKAQQLTVYRNVALAKISNTATICFYHLPMLPMAKKPIMAAVISICATVTLRQTP